MVEKKAVFLITNKYNNRHYVGISNNIDHEWLDVKRKLKLGVGIRKMREDYDVYGEEGFTFEIMYRSDDDYILHRRESELAYKYKVWQNGYNSEPLLNYNSMPEDKLAFDKLRFYKLIDTVTDGKYMFMDLQQILDLDKNDLQILLREITPEEMQYFKKRITLRNTKSSLANIYIQVSGIEGMDKKVEKVRKIIDKL